MSPVDHPGGRKVRGRVSRAVLGSFGLQFLSMFEDRENLPILAIRANPNGRTKDALVIAAAIATSRPNAKTSDAA